MVRFIVLIALLLAGAIAAPYLMGNKGYVMIAAGDYIIDATVSSAVVMVIGFYFTLLAIEALINRLTYSLGWFNRYHQARAKIQTEKGILALASGDFKRAETLTLKAAKKAQVPVLNYLAAAQSAQGLGNEAKRDEYLLLAHQNAHKDTFAVELTQAKLQVEQQQFEQAFASLSVLHDKHPKNKVVLALFKNVCIERKEWSQLLSIISALQKQKLLTANEADELRKNSHFQHLGEVAKQQGSTGLLDTWSSLPKTLKHDGRYLAETASLLMARNDDQSAYLLIMDALGNELYPELVSLTPKLNLTDYHALIERLKRLQQSREGSGLLAVCIGQLMVKEGRWGEAVEELSQGISQSPSTFAYVALAQAYEKLGRVNEANTTYKQSLSYHQQA
ncbi:heme biosynthesis HemY N-terminal domain-containing protein [Moritella sp. Urea-trap-13]|uniref:heme biosynthesis HemY N-terminal domain-containing protein n=1 Tax=Moritella sp. Urea-trap-13 TaxID=2058327 RepID=UPI000C332D5D|nr:heme biosynthesis HemY N-terminal domain-containing protein [Moritella sp. Urea-trap-13]PKH07644.1 heme biosynthesis protein [Moritella sp. Urea-trap-13]